MTDRERLQELLTRQTEAGLPFLVFWVERESDHDRIQCASNLGGGSVVAEPLTLMLHRMFQDVGVAAPGPIKLSEVDHRTSGEG